MTTLEGSVGKYISWDAFCASVFDECGKSGQYLRMLYGAGGMALLVFLISAFGLSPFFFATWLLGFLATPLGAVAALTLGAIAVPALQHLFSERKTLEPVLKRLAEAKRSYDAIEVAHAGEASPERKQCIDVLYRWVLKGGARPLFEG